MTAIPSGIILLALGGLFSSWLSSPIELGASQSATMVGQDLREAPAIDLAICLDTSGSMDGLIGAAKQKLWSIVNELATAQPKPSLRVALITYGNDGHAADRGWVQVQAPLTTDLDTISLKLFALETNGGTEYVGRALQVATDQLPWSTAKGALKLIVVAGNESADQDNEVLSSSAARQALAKGILVQALYCGSAGHVDASGWAQLARLAEGSFAAIDQDNGTLVIASPFDQSLAAMGVELNKTYLPFGSAGDLGCSNQVAQDKNAESLNWTAAANRAIAKGGGLYRCDWDLVDRCLDPGFELGDVKLDELPELMRKLTLVERRAFVETTRQKRTVIREEIAALQVRRDAFVAEELARLPKREQQSFELAILLALRTRAQKAGLSFPSLDTSCGTPLPGLREAAFWPEVGGPKFGLQVDC